MKLYFDSMCWIYFFEENPSFHPPVRSLLEEALKSRAQLLSSHLILAEVLVVPKRNGDAFTTAKYRRYFLSSAVTLIPLNADVAERFADLRSSTRVKPADALHLALAASNGADYFITYDTKLHGLRVRESHASAHRKPSPSEAPQL